MAMGTVRLTMAQALVRALASQWTVVDGDRVRLFAGVWAIFGHGNVSGVGERAVWQSTLKEINAEKNNVLCDIGVVGPGHSAGATPEKLGALCNKIFAAM